MNIKFHCDNNRNFKNEHQQIRGFIYKDYSIELHSHDFYEINIVMSGSAVHQIEHEYIDVKKGDIFVIPPMIAHAYHKTKSLDVFHILLQKSFILQNKEEAKNIPGFLQLIEIEPFLRQHTLDKSFLHLSENQLIQLQSDLNIIDENCKHNEFDEDALQPLKNHTTWKIIYMFSLLIFKQNSGYYPNSLNKYNIEILRSLEYIHQSYETKITIESLCKKAFLSRSTYIRAFKKICGCSPMEYVNKYRCQKVLEIIEESNMSKTEIAHCCGFYDLSHMERALKKFNQKR